MIARSHRFHGYGSLRSVYQRGHVVRGSQLSLKFYVRGAARPYRVAVVVSRKVSKSAVVRNRIRRRIYELVRLRAQNIPPGMELVFTAFSSELAEIDRSKLEQSVNSLLDKAIRSS